MENLFRQIKCIPKPYLVLLGILLIVVITFSPSLQNGFVNWDDPDYILQNPQVRTFSLKNTADIFKSHILGRFLPATPLTVLSYSLEYKFFQFTPFYYHLNNLLLHLLNTALLFVLLSLFFNNYRAIAVVVLLFGIHPLNVEPVNWITSRKDLLYTFFYLSSLIAFLWWRSKPEKNIKYYVLSLLLFILSLLSKGSAVTMPLVILLISLFYPQKSPRGYWLAQIPFWMLSIIFGLINLYSASSPGNHYESPYTASPWMDRIYYSSYALFLYLEKIIYPFDLSVHYPIKAFAKNVVVLGASLPCIFFLFLLIKHFSKKDGIFCFLFFVLTIFPVLHMFGITDSIIYDRYAYLPAIGIYMLIGLCVEFLSRGLEQGIKHWRHLLALTLGAYLLLFPVISFNYSQLWRDSQRLWRTVIAQFPEDAFAYNNLGVYYMIFGHDQIAVQYFQQAIRINPYHFNSFLNLGIIFARNNYYEEALQAYSQGIAVNPKYDKAYQYRAMIYVHMEKYGLALADFNKVLSMDPMNLLALEKVKEIQNKLLTKTEK